MKAFPAQGYNDGMDLRDYFAIRIAEAMISKTEETRDAFETAKTAYRMADLMMTVREKK